MILVDTSVIVDILTKDADWFEWSSTELERWADRGPVCYDAIIFAELAVNFDTQRRSRIALPHSLSWNSLWLRHSKPAKPLENIAVRAARKPVRCRTSSSARTPTWLIYLCSLETRAAFGRFSLPFA